MLIITKLKRFCILDVFAFRFFNGLLIVNLLAYTCFYKFKALSEHNKMQIHPKKERAYMLIKPDGVQRSLIGEIIGRIERSGLKIAGLKMFVPDKDRLIKHYGKSDEWYQAKGETMIKNLEAAGKPVEKSAIDYGKGIIDSLVSFMSAGPVVAIAVEGNEAVAVVTKLVGGTEPKTSDVGTIGGDYTLDSYNISNIDFRAVRNLCHCSESVEEAKREISLWFNDSEITNYRNVNDAILYDVNLDGILE